MLKYSQASCLYLPALRHLTLTTKSEEAIIVEHAAVRVKTANEDSTPLLSIF